MVDTKIQIWKKIIQLGNQLGFSSCTNKFKAFNYDVQDRERNPFTIKLSTSSFLSLAGQIHQIVRGQIWEWYVGQRGVLLREQTSLVFSAAYGKMEKQYKLRFFWAAFSLFFFFWNLITHEFINESLPDRIGRNDEFAEIWKVARRALRTVPSIAHHRAREIVFQAPELSFRKRGTWEGNLTSKWEMKYVLISVGGLSLFVAQISCLSLNILL